VVLVRDLGMRRQPRGQRNGGQFARDTRGATPPPIVPDTPSPYSNERVERVSDGTSAEEAWENYTQHTPQSTNHNAGTGADVEMESTTRFGRMGAGLSIWWMNTRSFFGSGLRGELTAPGLRSPAVARALLHHPRIREWMLSNDYTQPARIRRWYGWSMLTSPHLTAHDWETFLDGIPHTRIPTMLVGDDRLPSSIAVRCINSSNYSSHDQVERLTRRPEVREHVSVFAWQRSIYASPSAPPTLAVRALTELSRRQSRLSNKDVEAVLRRKDAHEVLTGYLPAHEHTLTSEQWSMLVRDERSGVRLVGDPGVPPSIASRYLDSPHASVHAEIAQQERLPEHVRVMAALRAGSEVHGRRGGGESGRV